jgi:N-acetyl-anhydromuramyl-L-alanine amidase AmpD
MYKNIVLHWTGGNYTPCSTDIECYHYLISGQGLVHEGKYKPIDNLNCTDGRYAAHCGGGNTGRIGIAICCRKNINTSPTKRQIESMCKLAAELCYKHGLQPKQVITHAEFGQQHPKTSSYGKIDITEIPYEGIKGVKECGSYLRNKVQWYYTKLKENELG